jgi:hypothetical protein
VVVAHVDADVGLLMGGQSEQVRITIQHELATMLGRVGTLDDLHKTIVGDLVALQMLVVRAGDVAQGVAQ